MVHFNPTSIPGTIHLVNTDSGNGTHTGNIVLNPTPSADPEDPLNWSKGRKLWGIAMVYVYTFGIGIATTVQYSILTNISEETGIALADLNTGTGLMFLFAGLVLSFLPWPANFPSVMYFEILTYTKLGLFALAARCAHLRKAWCVCHFESFVHWAHGMDGLHDI